jgi:hypothetical protein
MERPALWRPEMSVAEKTKFEAYWGALVSGTPLPRFVAPRFGFPDPFGESAAVNGK